MRIVFPNEVIKCPGCGFIFADDADIPLKPEERIVHYCGAVIDYAAMGYTSEPDGTFRKTHWINNKGEWTSTIPTDPFSLPRWGLAIWPGSSAERGRPILQVVGGTDVAD